MYNIAPRTVPIKTTTGDNVGPSTYVICTTHSKKQNYFPFLSSKPLAPTFVSRFNTDAIYDVRECRTKIRGGSSLRNRAHRFVYRTRDTPSPSRYNPRPIAKKPKLKLDPTKPKLYICAVPYSSTISAPSIPSKVDENGYELDDEGRIIKVHPDEKIPIEPEIKGMCDSGKGWRWSCRTSERFQSSYETEGPGPAAYSSKVPKCKKAEEDERYREMARLFSFLPRFVEAQEMKALRDNLPGPGTYDLPSPDKKEAQSINPKPFISGTGRFSKLGASDTPAPNRYCVCDCSQKKKQFSIKCAPFGVVAPRFKKKKTIYIPGPASYEIKGPLQQKMESKKNRWAMCDPPFNSTAPRSASFVPRDSFFTPSSADYPELKDSDCDETQEIYSSVFKNCVERFFSPADKKDSLSPATYHIGESYSRVRNRKCYSVSEVPFNSSGVRSKTPAVKSGVPCPTTYNTEVGLDSKSCRFNLTPRFTCEEETPGPGAYNIHPRLESSTYKAVDTHNLKLKESVIRKKLRTAPIETRKQWCAILKKEKLLRWFNIELDFEERMILLIKKLFDKPV